MSFKLPLLRGNAVVNGHVASAGEGGFGLRIIGVAQVSLRLTHLGCSEGILLSAVRLVEVLLLRSEVCVPRSDVFPCSVRLRWGVTCGVSPAMLVVDSA